jgi:hypothetical protein
MPEHDFLMGTMTVGDSLIILANGGVMTMSSLPLANNEGILSSSETRRLDGAPGCVGHRAFTSFGPDGPLMGAWISAVGVHVTTIAQHTRISNDINWKALVNVSTLDQAILTWDEERQILVMDYDSDNDGYNDHCLFFHMSQDHQKQNGRPKITGPHYRKANCVAKANLTGEWLWWTGSLDRNIYNEWDGSIVDHSYVYNVSGIVPMIVKSGKIYDDVNYAELNTLKIVVRHDNFNGTVGTLRYDYGRDSQLRSSSVTKNLSLSGVCQSEVFIGRQSEWAQFTISHLTSGQGSIGSIKLLTAQAGDAGTQ